MDMNRRQARDVTALQTPDLCPPEALSVMTGPTQRTGAPESLV